MKKYDNQDGRSMIEMLGVLAIVGVLSVAGIAGYSKAMGKYKSSKAMDQVSTIAANVKTMFANMGAYPSASLTNANALKLGLFPEEMTKTCGDSNQATCVMNALNGTTVVAGAGTNFTITMNSLPREACVSLATSEWGGSSGFQGLTVGGTAVTSFSAAATNCADTNNTIVWTFY